MDQLTPHYDGESSNNILLRYSEMPRIKEDLTIEIALLDRKLTSKKAQEYLMQGVLRRVLILTRCIENIFTAFPISRTDPLPEMTRTDININLHAFSMNVYGSLDNLAWVHALEKELYNASGKGTLTKLQVGLFKKEMKPHLGENTKRLVTSNPYEQWHKDYCQNYRDALAHRIPLYVPPSVIGNKHRDQWELLQKQLLDPLLTEQHEEIIQKQRQLGKACPAFAHSFSENSKPIMLHAQILTDLETVKEIIFSFCEDYSEGVPPSREATA